MQTKDGGYRRIRGAKSRHNILLTIVNLVALSTGIMSHPTRGILKNMPSKGQTHAHYVARAFHASAFLSIDLLAAAAFFLGTKCGEGNLGPSGRSALARTSSPRLIAYHHVVRNDHQAIKGGSIHI